MRVSALATLAALLVLAAPLPADLVAFSGKDANGNDEFAFVAVSDIANGTVIYFTNYDWDNTVGAFPTTLADEGTLRFTAASPIPAGTVVHVAETSVNTYTASGGHSVVHVSGIWAAVSADPHYAFAASVPATPLSSVTEVYAYLDSDPDVAVGGVKDPRTGSNSSPDAIVLDFAGSQPVGADFIRNRTTAGPANLTNPVNFIESFSATNLDLD